MPGSLQRSRRTRESGQDEGLSLRLVFLQLVPLLTPPPLLLTPPFGNLFPALDTRKVAGPGRGLASSWGRRAWAQVLCPRHVPEFNGVAGQIGVWGRAGDARAWRVCGQRARLAPGPRHTWPFWPAPRGSRRRQDAPAGKCLSRPRPRRGSSFSSHGSRVQS